jgi:DNA invertase Pin-like site-specific DNA recombinase
MTPVQSIRVAIFASVSSPQQASVNKDSLPSQVRDGREWAASIEGHVVAVYQVPGHSRKYIFFQDAERDIPAYRALHEGCENHAFDVLWCRARDRLGRTDALIAQVEALVANAGAEVYSARMPHALGQSSESGTIYLAAIERATAQTENIVKSRRHRIGMKARIRRGLPASQWAYGYRPIRDEKGQIVGGEFTPEIDAVRLATDRFLASTGYDNIAAALNDSPWRPRSADRWRYTSVRQMLLNDIYAGYVRHGDIVSDHPSDKFPALWDAETHRAIVAERRLRAQQKGGRAPASIVSGIAICARCGWKMTAHRDRNERLYYICAKHNTKQRWGPCHCNCISVDRIIEAVHKTLAALASPAALDTALAQSAPDRADIKDQVRRAQATLQNVQAKRQRLALALADGQMTGDVYRLADDQLIEDLEHATHLVTDAQARLATIPSLDDRRAALQKLIATPAWLLDSPIEDVRPLLLRSGLRVHVENGQIVEVIISLKR